MSRQPNRVAGSVDPGLREWYKRWGQVTQRIGVVDAVTARERGGDQGQQLVPDVRSTRGSPEVEVGVDELLQTEMLGERGRQQQPRVGHQAVVVEGRFKPVEAMR